MKKYKHIYFDLDRTLWDFETNSQLVLKEIYIKHQLQSRGIPTFNDFHKSYLPINHQLWDNYRIGAINKEFLNLERFYATLRSFNIQDKALAKAIGNDYVNLSPHQTALFPGTHELLNKLQHDYHLHIITNGFLEVQTIKLKTSKLENYFEKIIISETTPWKKPTPDLFLFALEQANAKAEESLMIGDDINADIKGAAAVGIDQVWTNFTASQVKFKPTYTVSKLIDILNLLN